MGDELIDFLDVLLRKIEREANQASYVQDSSTLWELRARLSRLPHVLKLTQLQLSEVDRLHQLIKTALAKQMVKH